MPLHICPLHTCRYIFRNAIVVVGATAIAAGIGPSQPFTIVGHIVPGNDFSESFIFFFEYLMDQQDALICHILLDLCGVGLPEFTIPPFTIIDPATNATHTFTEILQEESSALIVLPLLAYGFKALLRIQCQKIILNPVCSIMEHITIAKVRTFVILQLNY